MESIKEILLKELAYIQKFIKPELTDVIFEDIVINKLTTQLEKLYLERNIDLTKTSTLNGQGFKDFKAINEWYLENKGITIVTIQFIEDIKEKPMWVYYYKKK